jgi:hypothetical protein
MNERLIRALESGKDLSDAIEQAAAPMRQMIEQFLSQQPFQPFRLSLTDRSAYEIRSPEGIRLTPYVLEMNAPDAAEPGGWRWLRTLALEHVVTLQPLIADEPAVVQRSSTGSK